MNTLHSMTPKEEWFVFNYGDTIPEVSHILKKIHENRYAWACNISYGGVPKQNLLANHIPARTQDEKCGYCMENRNQ